MGRTPEMTSFESGHEPGSSQRRTKRFWFLAGATGTLTFVMLVLFSGWCPPPLDIPGLSSRSLEDISYNEETGLRNSTLPTGAGAGKPRKITAPSVQPRAEPIAAVEQERINCTWKPGGDAPCLSLLETRIAASANESSANRWVFAGDSTMSHLFRHLKKPLHPSSIARKCGCAHKRSERCNMGSALGQKQIVDWKSPIKGREGPLDFGKKNPQCQDCSGCNSDFLECSKPCTQTQTSYFSVEFARDVEIQTTVANSTQEALAFWAKHQSSSALQGKLFVCVVNAGLHDQRVSTLAEPPDTSLLYSKVYLANVGWYLRLLQPVCIHVIWVTTTAPQGEKNWQRTNTTMHWNNAVANLVLHEFPHSVTILDHFDASKSWPHVDNVHLSTSFYQQLAALFTALIERTVVSTLSSNSTSSSQPQNRFKLGERIS